MEKFTHNVTTIGIIEDCIGIESQWKKEPHTGRGEAGDDNPGIA